MAVQAASACSFWVDGSGATWVTLYADPGGDGAIYVYVDGAQKLWLSTKNRRFYVTNAKNAVVRAYNSQLEWACGN